MLRETGQSEAAEKMRREDLAAAVDEARTKNQSDSWVEQKLETIFATELDRVANAVVLAELIAPLLVPAAPRVEAQVPAMPAAPAPLEPGFCELPKPPADPGDIAHFIDEMLAQEKSALRSTGLRCAS